MYRHWICSDHLILHLTYLWAVIKETEAESELAKRDPNNGLPITWQRGILYFLRIATLVYREGSRERNFELISLYLSRLPLSNDERCETPLVNKVRILWLSWLPADLPLDQAHPLLHQVSTTNIKRSSSKFCSVGRATQGYVWIIVLYIW